MSGEVKQEYKYVWRWFRLVRHRVGFTGGVFGPGFGVRLVLFGLRLFFGSNPIQNVSWGRMRPQEPN